MANNLFLKLTDIEGDCEVTGHEKEIDVYSIGSSVYLPGNLQQATGASSGNSSAHDITVTKYADASSHALFAAASAGTHIAEAVLSFNKAGSEPPVEYMKITLKPVMISNWTASAGSGSNSTETLSLNFAEMKIEYKPQSDTGSEEAAKTAGWNFRTGKKAE